MAVDAGHATRVLASHGATLSDSPVEVFVDRVEELGHPRSVRLMVAEYEGIAHMTRDEARTLAVAILTAAGDPE